jgi:hypothetical protein
MANDTTDCELTVLAAKAAGIRFDAGSEKPHPKSGAWFGLWLTYDREPTEHDRRYWRPLTDDGDALRLAVALSLDLSFLHEAGNINRACKLISVDSGGPWTPCVREDVGADPLAATRRAIVRAAAEIGSNMP